MSAKNSNQDRESVGAAMLPESVVWCLQHYVEAYAERFEVKEEVSGERKVLRVFLADRQP
jgi:hypothetical protein